MNDESACVNTDAITDESDLHDDIDGPLGV
jgi:hypothetical protein